MSICVAHLLKRVPVLAFLGLQVIAQPKIEFSGSTIHDFGNIYKGQQAVHLFAFKNAGTDTLIVTGVSAGCGCTAALVSSSRIPPDSVSDLKVSFSSGAFVGFVMKSVTVSSNDPKTPSLAVHVKATVIPILAFDPGSLVFNLTSDSLALYQSSLKIKNKSGRPLRFLSVEPRFPGLEVKLDKKFVKDGDSLELHATLKAKGFKGFTGGEVFFKTDFEPMPDQGVQVMVAGGQK